MTDAAPATCADGGGNLALALPPGSACGALAVTKKTNHHRHHAPRSLAQRRADRDAHTHGTVWTKDPHGGPHAPADPGGVGAAGKAADAAAHAARVAAEAWAGPRPLPGSGSGGAGAPPLGYARPAPPGPTTNFVGDAMVGGAAALVGARLAAANEAAAAAAAAALPPVQPPRLLLVEGGGGGGDGSSAATALVPAQVDAAALRAQALSLIGAIEGKAAAVAALEGA
jgi:hypothetical protein